MIIQKIVSLSFLLFFLNFSSCDKTVGVLYEVWHTWSSNAMRNVAKKGGELLTTEKVIQSNGKYILDDVLEKYGESAYMWNAKPKDLGFYCIYRHRENETGLVPDCENIEEVTTKHAKMLTDAGYDYVALDHTNWPTVSQHTDVWVLRPTEVLFEEWLKLRKRGIPTPQIAIWPCSPKGSNTWKWFLDNIYNTGKYDELILKMNGKKVVFIPSNPWCYDEKTSEMIKENGGRNDIQIINMWSMFGVDKYEEGWWGYFSICLSDENKYTSSIVGAGRCNQPSTQPHEGIGEEISASGSYITAQTSLPFAAPGKLRGLTVQRLFTKILERQPPHIFLSSFNEHIGGRQDCAYPNINTCFNMGLPHDPQRRVWIDTYGAEFGRDLEPTEEGGSMVWDVSSACISLYKQGKTCEDSPESLCCTKEDKEVFANVWSLRNPKDGDHLLTSKIEEFEELTKKQGWVQVCAPFPAPSVFCYNTTITDGRDGPFIIFNQQVAEPKTKPLYRCYAESMNAHFFSLDSQCEGQKLDFLMGYIQDSRGNEMLRELKRCKTKNGKYVHALDLECDEKDIDSLGFVR